MNHFLGRDNHIHPKIVPRFWQRLINHLKWVYRRHDGGLLSDQPSLNQQCHLKV